MGQQLTAHTRWFWIRRILLAISSTAVAFAITLKTGMLLDSIMPIRDPYTRFTLLHVAYWLLAVLLTAVVALACRASSDFLWASLRATALVAVLPILPVLLHVPPLARSAQKRTMAAMRTIADSMAAYRETGGAYPRVSSVDELARLLGRPLPLKDEWRTPFMLSAEPGRYVLTSYGSDGRLDGERIVGPTTEFSRDIVLVNGVFVAWPEGFE